MFWYCGELIEGDLISLNIYDPGLLYGATVFTTIKVYHQSLDHYLTHWQKHCDRVNYSLSIFKWSFPNWERVREGAQRLISFYPVLRVAIFSDGREFIIGRHLPLDLNIRQQNGVVADVEKLPRGLPEHKTGNYLSSFLALQKGQELQAQETILKDEKNWLETSTGNLWGWQDGCWYTPSLKNGILPGIARENLLRWLDSLGNSAKENDWNAGFVEGLEAIAYSNSVVEVIPIREVIEDGRRRIYNPSHPALSQLRSYFEQ